MQRIGRGLSRDTERSGAEVHLRVSKHGLSLRRVSSTSGKLAPRTDRAFGIERPLPFATQTCMGAA